MHPIKAILIDCDGVLTDGKLNIGSGGAQFKSFHSRDVRAIRELIARGWEVVICTASSSEINKEYAAKVGALLEVSRDKEPVAAKYAPYIAIGDDTWDLKMLEQACIAFCPSDAAAEVLALPKINKLKTAGGQGCIAEMLLWLHS